MEKDNNPNNSASFDTAKVENNTVDQTGNAKKSKKGLIALIVLAVILVGAAVVAAIILNREKPEQPNKPIPAPVKPSAPFSSDSGLFGVNYFKNAYIAEEHYKNILISPYSMEAVWQIADRGAAGNTKIQIQNMLGSEREMPEIAGLYSANAAFIRETVADKIKNEFIDSVKGDVIYDSFSSPDTINAWVNQNTNGMIPSVLNDAPQGDLVLANAVAMEQDWSSEFDCTYTRGEEFTSSNGNKVEAAMMYGGANYYFKTDNSEGVVRNYKAGEDGNYLEFVAFLPNNSINDYVKDSFESDLTSFDEKLIAPSRSDEEIVNVNVSLPRFKYDYDVPRLVEMFSKGMGVSDAFDGSKADFSGISDETSFYVSNLIQKTFVEMNETGTRAAAVTAMAIGATAALDENKPKEINYYVDLNRPFVYLIRDHNTKEIIFEGVVEDPELMSNYHDCAESEE